MSIRLQIKRWRALYRVPRLTANTPEGAIVHATGIARIHDDEDPFIAPITSRQVVVALMKHTTTPLKPQTQGIVYERLQIRPFLLETETLRVIVDASHVELLMPTFSEGRMLETSVAAGDRVTIVGSVLRDGALVTSDELTFRETAPMFKLVGNKATPIVIMAA